MANDRYKAIVEVGFTYDKAGLQTAQNELDRIAAMGGKLNATEELKKAGQMATQLSNILDQTFNKDLGTINVTKFNQALAKSKIDMNQVKTTLQSVGPTGAQAYNALGKAILGTNVQLKQSNKLVDQMALSMANTVKWGITSSIFNSITSSIQKAYYYSVDLDRSLNDIRIVTDKSAESMSKFAVEANEAAKTLGAKTLDYTEASLIYYQQGLSDEEVKARTETTIKAANVTGQTGEEVSEQLTAVWNGYKVSAEEAESYVDKLAAVASTTAADLEELSVGMSKVASAANSMGVDVDQLNAQLATIVSVTRQAPESVGTALKTIYARMGDLAIEGEDEFGTKLGDVSGKMMQMGIMVTDQQGNLRDMGTVIEEVAAKWDTWTEAQKQAAAVAMAGKRQYNNLIALFDNWDMYTEALNTSQNSLGTLQKQQNIYLESTDAKLNELRATSEDLWDSLIDSKEVNKGIGLLKNIVQVGDNFVDAFGGGSKAILAFGATFASVFNKQISNAIVNSMAKQRAYQENLDNLKLKIQTIQAGAINPKEVANNGETPQFATVQDMASYQGYEKQLEIARQIQSVRAGLTSEEYNQLITLQQQTGELTEKQVLLQNEANILKVLNEQERSISEGILISGDGLDKLNIHWQELNDRQKDSVSSLTQMISKQDGLVYTEEERANLRTLLTRSEKEEIQLTKDQETLIKTILTAEEGRVSINHQQREHLKQILQTEQNNLKISQDKTKAVNDTVLAQKEENQKAQEQERLLKAQLDARIKNAKESQNIVQWTTGITTGLSSMTSAWNAVNSLAQTFNDKNATAGDKTIQVITTLSMTVPMLVSNFSRLNEAMGAEGIWKAWRNNMKAAKTETVGATVAQTGLQGALHSTKTAVKSLGAAIAANPIGALITVATLAAAAFSFFNARQKQLQEELEETRQKNIEAADAAISEADAYNELAQSYEKTYKAYKEGNASKTDLAETTEELIDKYDIENGKVLLLTEQYEELAEAIKKARKERLNEAQSASVQVVNDEKSKIAENVSEMGLHRYADATQPDGNSYALRTDLMIADDTDGSEAIISRALGDDAHFGSGGFFLEAKDSISGVMQIYDQLMLAKDALAENGLTQSESFKEVDAQIRLMEERVLAYKDAVAAFGDTTVEKIFVDFNTDVDNFKDFQNEVKNIKESFQKEAEAQGIDYSEEDIDALVNSHIAALDSEFSKRYALVTELEGKIADIDRFTDEELTALVNVSLTGKENVDQLKQIIQIAKDSLLPEDTTIFMDLRAKVTDSKLNKTELEEYKTQLAAVGADFSGELNQFEDRSQLGQIEVLNEITEKQVQANNEWIKSSREVAKERKKNAEDLKKEASDKWLELEQQKEKQGDSWTEDQQKELDAAKEQYKWLKSRVAYFENIMENGLSMDEIDTTILDNLSSSIDGIITKADALYNATSMIGEGWTVAASDVRKFIDLYPEMLDGHEFLADGTMQLNQEVVNDYLASKQAEIQANSEAKQEEVRQQLEIYKTRLKYNQEKLKLLDQYLNGEISAGELEDKIEKQHTEFSLEMENLIGTENTNTANKQIENVAGVAENTINFLNEIGAAYEKLNDYAAKAIVGQAEGSYTASSVTTEKTKIDDHQMKVNKHDMNSMGIDEEEYRRQIQEIRNAIAEQVVQEQNSVNEYEKLLAELGASANSAAASINSVMSGDAGKLGEKGSDKQADRMDALEDEIDIYHELNNEIKKYSNNLSILQKQQDGLLGTGLMANLDAQLENLHGQIAAYQTKLAMQKADLELQKQELANRGIMFNGDDIANYSAIISFKTAEINSLIEIYNNVSGKLKETYKDQIDTMKKDLESLIGAMDKYEDLLYNQMQETQESLIDLSDQIFEVNLKKFTMEIELRLNTIDAQRNFNEFKRKVIDQIDDDDILANAKAKIEDFYTYYNDKGTGEIQALTKMINETLAELDKGEEGLFAGKEAEGQELLREYQDKLMESMQNLEDLIDEIKESYLDLIDEANDKLDEHAEKFEKIRDTLEHNANLIELLYGDDAYALMGEYYDAQERNNNANLEFFRKERDFWKQQMETAEEGTEAWQKFYENYQEAQENLNDLIESSLELIIEKYQNAVKGIMDTLENELTGGLGLDYLGEEWELVTEKSDAYLDKISQIYEAQKLANKITDTINDQDLSLKAQEKLNKLYEQQVTLLREKEKVTKYDVDRANALYELALKQIALEEQQNNKNKMHLTRDSQGNWSYNYVADEEGVASKQQELLDAQNSLYSIDKEAYQKNLDDIYNMYREWQEKVAELYMDTTLTEEEFEAKKNLYADYYGERINDLVGQNADIKQNLTASSFGMLGGLYEQDSMNLVAMGEEQTAYILSLTENFKGSYTDLEEHIKENYDNIQEKSNEVVSAIVEEWDSSIQQMIERFATNEDSFKSICIIAYEELDAATEEYQASLDELQEAADIDFSNIRDYITATKDETDVLRDATDQLTDSLGKQFDTMRENLATIESLIGKYNGARDAAIAAASAIRELNSAIANAASVGSVGSYGSGHPTSTTTADSPETSDTPKETKPNYPSPDPSNFYRDIGGGMFEDIYGNDYRQDEIPRDGIIYYDTGGYTGEWNTKEGKIAMLHEKELVLNQDDTENVLATVQAVRGMTGIISALKNSMLNNIIQKTNTLNTVTNYSFATDSQNNGVEQKISINAEFPNARNSAEIENAFNNLVNRATQFAHSQKNRTQ